MLFERYANDVFYLLAGFCVLFNGGFEFSKQETSRLTDCENSIVTLRNEVLLPTLLRRGESETHFKKKYDWSNINGW
jgi:hypothetical protein